MGRPSQGGSNPDAGRSFAHRGPLVGNSPLTAKTGVRFPEGAPGIIQVPHIPRLIAISMACACRGGITRQYLRCDFRWAFSKTNTASTSSVRTFCSYGFDRGKSKLAAIYCHYFAADPNPEETWAIDETVQWFGTSRTGRPLETGKLLPSDQGGRPGVHWDKGTDDS